MDHLLLARLTSSQLRSDVIHTHAIEVEVVTVAVTSRQQSREMTETAILLMNNRPLEQEEHAILSFEEGRHAAQAEEPY